MDQEADASQHHSHGQAHAHAAGMGALDRAVNLINTNRTVLLVLFAVIIIVAVFLRTGLLRFPGLFEPDGYYYYALAKATLANGFVEPLSFGLSGFPAHNAVGEAPGLIYLAVIGYSIFGGLGASLLQVMRWLPVLWGVLEVVVSYFLVRYLANSRVAGLLAALFLATSSGNLARTTALVYRGDTFVPLFLMLSLLFMLETFRLGSASGRKRYICAALAAVFLSAGVVLWNGAPFMTMVYMAALVFVLIYGFLRHDREILGTNLLLAEFLFVAYLLEHVYGWLGLARTGLLLIDTSFFAFYIPLLIGCFLAWYSAKNHGRYQMLAYPRARMILVGIVVLVMFIAAAVTFNSGVSALTNAIALTNTNAPPPSGAPTNSTLNQAIGTTTQELQKASFGFLFTSFALQLFIAPIAVVLYVLFNRRTDQYLLVLLAYLLVAAVLQAGQIRFNSLLSVPLAIFAGYGVYAIGQRLWNAEISDRVTGTVVAVAVSIVLAVVALFKILPQFNGQALLQSFGGLLTAPFSINTQAGFAIELSILIVEALLALAVVYLAASAARGRMRLVYVFVPVVAAILIYGFYSSYGTSITSTPADGVNPQFLSAMVWMSQNTPANSTVLSIWPDGSVIEAIANRQSYTDSVGGENGTKILLTSQYLFNTTSDTSFLYGIGRPDYIVARSFWFQEIAGLATEGLVQNQQSFGYQTFQGLNVTRGVNRTVYSFYSNSPPYYTAELEVFTRANGSRTAAAFLGARGSNRYAEFSKIILYDSDNYNYSIVYANTTNTLNYTFLVSYAGNGITGGALLGQSLVQSNLFNLIMMCNQYFCPIDNANVTYQPVFMNNDTRIYKVIYK